jgi:hypothetical protein
LKKQNQPSRNFLAKKLEKQNADICRGMGMGVTTFMRRGGRQTSLEECAPVAGQIKVSDLTGCAGLSKSEDRR